MKRFVVLVLIIAFSSTAFAAEGGPVVANIQKEISLPPKNTVLPPVVREAYEYYEICGCCEADLKGELKQKCITWKDGRKYDALTNWKVKWDYGHNRAGKTCSADSFTVTVNVRYHLPKWAKPAEAPRELIGKWESYTKNLLTHENGHRDRAVDAAADLTRTVADLPPFNTCSELDREVNIISRARMKRLEGEQQQYDRETGHGAAQGALFP
jgi:predicted secreted Zn-dependent protease